jgi:pseudouridine synthase
MHDYTDKSRGVRLQKALAEAGVASRRECETFIQAGRVRVNGQVVATLPAWVNAAEDRLELDGEPVAKPRSARSGRATAGKHYVLMHKPRNVVSTVRDEPGKDRTTVVDLVDHPSANRLYPVGRLDADSTGLILLTDDGELTHRLTHPSFGITKRYLVSVKGRVTGDDLDRLKHGLVLADRGKDQPSPKRAMMEAVRIVKQETDRTRGDRTTLSVTLTEGQNREIRRLLARLGFKVRKLKRTAMGPLQLKGLSPGHWRPLTTAEVRALRKATRGG